MRPRPDEAPVTSATLPLKVEWLGHRPPSSRRKQRRESESRTPWGLVGLLVRPASWPRSMSARCRPSLPSIRAELGASLSQAGWLLSMVNLITALGGMAIALTADRFGHRRLILLGTALCCVASLLRRLRRQRRRLLVGAFFEGLGFICRRRCDPDPAAARRPRPPISAWP